MKIKGTKIERNVELEVTREEVIKTLLAHFEFSDDCYVKDGVIYESVDMGNRGVDYEQVFVTDDELKVQILNAILLLQRAYRW